MSIPHDGCRKTPRAMAGPSLTSIGYKSMLGAGTDDTTSFHPGFDFCGKERADRPDCLFYLHKSSTKHREEPTEYLVWNGRVLLDYRDEAIRAFELPLTISSRIGQEEARLEAMLRYDARVEWKDILARILPQGETSSSAFKFRNQLNMRLVRFRLQARLLSHHSRFKNEAMETYLLTTMTAEMVAKNTTRGLADMDPYSDEKAFVELLNRKLRKKDLLEEGWRRRQETKLTSAEAWAQRRIEWEAKNPIPAPSYHGKAECTSIESIVAFKLASMSHYRQDGGLVWMAGYLLQNAAPQYYFNTQGMREFFGGRASPRRRAIEDAKDPYGLLGSPVSTEAQICLADFLLEPARMQYQRWTLVRKGMHKPIFITDPNESYWGQLEALQSGFEKDWAELGRTGKPPVLHGLMKLDYDSMTWNSDQIPILNLVLQSIDSCTKTFAAWQRQQAQKQRAELRQRRLDFEDDETDGEGSEGDKELENVRTEEREGGEDDVAMDKDGRAEVLEEDETEGSDGREDETEEGEEF